MPLLLGALLLGGAIGIGFLLRWLLSAVELGTTILIGLLLIPLTIRVVGWVTDALSVAAGLTSDDEAAAGAVEVDEASAYPRRSAPRKARRSKTAKQGSV